MSSPKKRPARRRRSTFMETLIRVRELLQDVPADKIIPWPLLPPFPDDATAPEAAAEEQAPTP